MMTLDDVGNVALAAAHQAAEFIVENLVVDKENPTPEEGEATSTAIIMTIASLEANLKLSLPDNVMHNTRAAIESLSHKMAQQVTRIKTAQINEIPKAPPGS